ncbi:NADH-quinone oxidoreductase subunit N [Sulfuriferula sp. AH1]|uniref:NADH-quinone oxidoreductase subunit NuoN n=1 Tax=Sulfuriferula sp. AH1 TaxID=1985873 RepID=UPI000B3B8BBE|nr:NADH-quinone oxidoreductase subunit NuoN [Sulfuriferula sp. AH1]ARU30724.1 NADH-quinone oxidoreductase subunit N [Sulfuriferula sp. AH1]
MNFAFTDLMPLLPELFLLAAVSFILILDLFLGDERRYVTYILSLAALLGCGWITFSTATGVTAYAMHGMFVDDLLADTLKLMLYFTVAVTLVYSREYIRERGMYQGEFFVLVLFATLGMMVMISASHLLTLYMGLELLSLSLYALVALQRDSGVATEAAMKYFVLGALASGMLLYGMSMLYGATGSLEIARIATVLQSDAGNNTVLVFGLVFIVAGLAFKLGVAPFHMWLPDVYHGAPTAVTLFIGTASKIAAFAFILRILAQGLQSMSPDWQQMMVIMAVLSMAVGNITAIAQTNFKRMLAYSTISHMGFLLLGLLSADINGYSSAMFYMLTYVLMGLGSFGMIMLLSRQGFEADSLEDLKGLNQRNPWYAFVMLLIMFSLAGIPPTIGFYAKLAVLQAVINAGYTWLAVVAVMFSLIGAFYYLRVVRLMYFDKPIDAHPIKPHADVSVLMSANGLGVLALGILPQPLMALCAYVIQQSL